MAYTIIFQRCKVKMKEIKLKLNSYDYRHRDHVDLKFTVGLLFTFFDDGKEIKTAKQSNQELATQEKIYIRLI